MIMTPFPSPQIGYRSMKGSQSINDLSSFPEPSSQGNTLPRSRGKEQTAVVVEKREKHHPSKRRIKPRRPVSLHVEALQRSMTGLGGGGGLSPTGDECGVGCGAVASGMGVGDKHSVQHQPALTMGDGAESDETVLGDLGESSSSGFVGSEVLVVQHQSPCPPSLVSSSAQFILNSPCSNFPSLAVTPELYRVGEEEKLKVEEEDLDRFSEDSLAESPGKQRRVSKRLAELARKIEQEDSLAIRVEDSLAMVDSLATDTVVPMDSLATNFPNVEDDSLLPVSSLPLMDSLAPENVEDRSLPLDSLLPDTGRLTEDSGLGLPTDSCQDDLLPVVNDVPTFTEQLTEINAALKDIEDHQERINLRVELTRLQRELKEMEKKEMICDTGSTNSPSRAKWRPMDVQIATDDLTCNPEMSFSYDNMAPLLGCYKSTSPPLPSNQPLLPPSSPQIRDKGYSPDSSSEDEEEETSKVLQSQLPVPVKAKLPPPIPNMPLLQEKPPLKEPKPVLVAAGNPVGVRDLQPAHPGPVGMTSMWIPSNSSNISPAASLSSSRSSLASPLTTSRSSLSSTRGAPPSPRTPRLRPRTNTGPTPNAPSLLSKRLSLLTPVLPDKSSPGLATPVQSIFSARCRLGSAPN